MVKQDITSVAIGGFDGMHLAHQELFSKLDKNGAIIVISTQYSNLSPNTNRTKHTNFPLFYYPLEEIKHLSAEQFVELLYEEYPNLKKIIVGYDFCFGYQAKADTKSLKKLFRGEVDVIKEFKIEGVSVHSRLIREHLRKGEIKIANKFLGYNYFLKGLCIKGQGLGSKEFVPTINIDVKDFLIPGQGVYITKTILKDKIYQSVSFVGHRASTDEKFAVETHILEKNFNEDIPKIVQIEFLKRLRENKKFEKYEQLKEQILTDIKKAKEWFEREIAR